MSDVVIPQERLAPIKELEVKMKELEQEFKYLNLQKENVILKVFVDFKLPSNANINPDGSITIPEPQIAEQLLLPMQEQS